MFFWDDFGCADKVMSFFSAVEIIVGEEVMSKLSKLHITSETSIPDPFKKNPIVRHAFEYHSNDKDVLTKLKNYVLQEILESIDICMRCESIKNYVHVEEIKSLSSILVGAEHHH